MLAALETNTHSALITDHPKPAPRTAPVPKPRQALRKEAIAATSPIAEEPASSASSAESESCDAKTKKLPEVVGVILKSPESSVGDTSSGRGSLARDLHVWSSLLSLDKAVDEDILSLYGSEVFPSEDSVSTTSSFLYHHESASNADDLSLDDVNMETFKRSSASNSKKFTQEQVATGVKENRSVTSLKSIDSIPGFLGSGNMKKWMNHQDLDNLSDTVETVGKWEVGDTTDTGMFQFLLTTAFRCFLKCTFLVACVCVVCVRTMYSELISVHTKLYCVLTTIRVSCNCFRFKRLPRICRRPKLNSWITRQDLLFSNAHFYFTVYLTVPY